MSGFFNSSSWEIVAPKIPTLSRCGECGLRKKCFSPMMAVSGKGRRKILFVGEAPGAKEDRKGKPFIGDAGQLLRRTVRALNLDLDDCWITNAVLCRPPNNEIDDIYIEACRPNLFKTIRKLQPRVIIPLGLSAVKSLITPEWTKDLGPLGRWVGWTIPSNLHKAWICPTYHPSYVKRMREDQTLLRIVKGHFKKAFALEKVDVPFLVPKALQKQIEIIEDSRSARRRIRDLATKKGLLAFDYETTGLKPDLPKHRIVCCSFCLNGRDTFACMINKRCHRSLSSVLLAPELGKIASNLKFEERWTRVKLGHGVVNWNWDTMIASHILDNRPWITSVKFQAFVLLGLPNYTHHVDDYLGGTKSSNGFNQILKANPKDLLEYNGLDSLLEYKVAEKQKEQMGWKER